MNHTSIYCSSSERILQIQCFNISVNYKLSHSEYNHIKSNNHLHDFEQFIVTNEVHKTNRLKLNMTVYTRQTEIIVISQNGEI